MDDSNTNGPDNDAEKLDLENKAALTGSSSEEFNPEKGVTRAYELKCNLGK